MSHPRSLSVKRNWSRVCSIALAVLLNGLVSNAGAAPAPLPEPARKEEPKKPPVIPETGLPDIENLLKNFPGGIDSEEMKLLQGEMQRIREETKRALERLRQPMPGKIPSRGAGKALNRPSAQDQSRLGARVEKPSAVLADQLELPKGQGLVIGQVNLDSAAARAGLKANDILLELNGKAVPNDAVEFARSLEDIKPNAPVDAVILRKGKKETMKGLSLPDTGTVHPKLPGVREFVR